MSFTFRMLCVCCLALLALYAVAGCNKIAEKAGEAAVEKMIEAETGGDVDMDIDGGKVTFKDEDGTVTSVVGEGAKMPENWPAALPQYPGSNVEMAHSVSGEHGEAWTVYMTTPDEPAKVAEFYDGKATAAGYKKLSTMSAEDVITAQYTSEQWFFHLTCSKDEEGTGITLMLSPNDEGAPE